MTSASPGRVPTNLAGLCLVQQITPIVNRFRVHEMGPDQTAGALLAFAEQKPLKLREEVTFFSSEDKTEALFGFKSRQIVDLHATTDVFDAQGTPLGLFRKDARASMTNSTWHLETPDGLKATGRERNKTVALLRRFGGLLPGALGETMEVLPWQFHFDFRDDRDQVVLSSQRKRAMRDQYLVTMPPLANGHSLDWRLAAAIGVALDIFQGR